MKYPFLRMSDVVRLKAADKKKWGMVPGALEDFPFSERSVMTPG